MDKERGEVRSGIEMGGSRGWVPRWKCTWMHKKPTNNLSERRKVLINMQTEIKSNE